jgi:D-serine deaminase-like pyridoxal phosphate-dependent protein
LDISSLRTPVVLVDSSRVKRNIDRAQAIADRLGVHLRPHAKTHKSPEIARWQIDRGAVGICCAKLGEAEVFADAGIADIRLPFPVNPSNASRVVALMERASMSIIVDHLGVSRAWSDAMLHAGKTLDVLVKVDVGFHRCGIQPDERSADFVKAVASLEGLRLRGLLSHAGHSYLATSNDELHAIAVHEIELLLNVQDRCTRAGIAIDELSVGSTPTLRFNASLSGPTELRPGNYVYFDRTQVGLGSATLEDCALTVLAAVVSKPAPDRIILDCGSKTLTSDTARGFSAQPGYGAVLTRDGTGIDGDLVIERLSEEHATVRAAAGTPLEPGDRVHILPNHSCVVANMVDDARLVEGDDVIGALAVSARGRIS